MGDTEIVAAEVARLRTGDDIDRLEADLLAVLTPEVAAEVLRERTLAGLAGRRQPDRWMRLASLQYQAALAQQAARRSLAVEADRIRRMALRSARINPEVNSDNA